VCAIISISEIHFSFVSSCSFYTYSKAENKRKAVSATSVYFESLPYRIHPEVSPVACPYFSELNKN
jgi:hypothetical protein